MTLTDWVRRLRNVRIRAFNRITPRVWSAVYTVEIRASATEPPPREMFGSSMTERLLRFVPRTDSVSLPDREYHGQGSCRLEPIGFLGGRLPRERGRRDHRLKRRPAGEYRTRRLSMAPGRTARRYGLDGGPASPERGYDTLGHGRWWWSENDCSVARTTVH